jgi:hypothetical protein
MYKTVLLPQILYASVVWWPTVSRLEAQKLLAFSLLWAKMSSGVILDSST